MSYFTKIPDELILEIFLYSDYTNLIKMQLLNNFITNQYSNNKQNLHKKLIKKQYKIVETNSSFNLQKMGYTLSIAKNKKTNYSQLNEYLHNI